jgi:LacI family transcriptional regulator
MRARKKKRVSRGSQRDVARAAQVSVATVSLALNNHPRVSRKTCLRVAEIASQLGYVPNQAARRLAQTRFRREPKTSFDQVGFIYLEPAGAGPGALAGSCLAAMSGAEHELARLGAALLFVRLTGAKQWDKVDRLRARREWTGGCSSAT